MIRRLDSYNMFDYNFVLSLVKRMLQRLQVSLMADPYWVSRKKCLELIELSSINKVSLLRFSPVVTLDHNFMDLCRELFRTDRGIKDFNVLHFFYKKNNTNTKLYL